MRPPRFDVALASCRSLPEPDPDAAPLTSALRERGLEVTTAPWDGDQFDWRSARMVLLRSTWNYYLDRDAFLGWIDSVADGSTLHNPAAVVRWNTDKRYLEALAARGIATVPTVHLRKGGACDLGALVTERDWSRIVIKPSVSAASFETHTMERSNLKPAILERLLASRDMMVQPFVESVSEYGERSIVLIDGQPTHSVRKAPRFGGESESIRGPMPIADDERALAIATVEAASDMVGVDGLLYARVDIARDADDEPMVMELELTEPSLFFAQGPAALEMLVDRIVGLVAH